MPALPTVSALTGSTVTEAQFKQALTDQREFLAALLGVDGSVPGALAAMGALISGYLARSAAYTVGLGDRGKLIDCTGSFTLSFAAASTLGAGFTVAVRNSGEGVITLDPAGTESIDGVSTLSLLPNESHLVVCTGSAWRSLGRAETSTLASAEYVNQSFGLFQTFGSLASGATRAVGSPSFMIWSSNSSTQWSRGTYYTNMFYMSTSGSGKSATTIQVNLGNCRHTIWNYSTQQSMQIDLTGVINCDTDDNYAFQIRRDGVTAATFGSYSGRTTRTVNFGNFAIAPNSTATFDLYGSILNGSGGDRLYVNAFTATYVQFS